jgi:ribokinase
MDGGFQVPGFQVEVVCVIAVVGSLNRDLVIRTERFPAPGETVLGSGFRTVPGGKGANQAVAMARLGARVGMVGAVGEDSFGAMMLEGLVRDGIDVRSVRSCAEESTGVAVITLDAAGENHIVVAPGANARLTAVDVEEGLARLAAVEPVQAVVLQLEVPDEAVRAATRWAVTCRIPLFVNAAPWRESVPASVFEQATWLILNRSEVSGLLGRSLSDLASIAGAVTAWRGTGERPGVVVTLGAEGAWLEGGGSRELVKAAPVERVVDTVGAGDAFVGGFVVGWMEGMGALAAARFAASVAAISVGRPGAQDAMPRRGEVRVNLAISMQ